MDLALINHDAVRRGVVDERKQSFDVRRQIHVAPVHSPNASRDVSSVNVKRISRRNVRRQLSFVSDIKRDCIDVVYDGSVVPKDCVKIVNNKVRKFLKKKTHSKEAIHEENVDRQDVDRKDGDVKGDSGDGVQDEYVVKEDDSKETVERDDNELFSKDSAVFHDIIFYEQNVRSPHGPKQQMRYREYVQSKQRIFPEVLKVQPQVQIR